MIVRAPGKIVLWGEYAVLAGAPAAVMAIDRWAQVELQPMANTWRFSSQGFLTPSVYKSHAQFCAAPTAVLAETILRQWGYTALPQPFQLISDSRAFHHTEGTKLGLGSSAAVCCATYIALAELLDQTTTVAEAIEIHRAFQGGKGSGLDVAASWYGGVIRFGNGATSPWVWPEDWHWQAVWTHQAALTQTSLGSFNSWQQNSNTGPLTRLVEASKALFDSPDLDQLQAYITYLQELDDAARLNIFTPEHSQLATIAQALGLVYKPCGAGGGDIGIACGKDPEAVQAFAKKAADNQFVPLALEIADHGVTVG